MKGSQIAGLASGVTQCLRLLLPNKRAKRRFYLTLSPPSKTINETNKAEQTFKDLVCQIPAQPASHTPRAYCGFSIGLNQNLRNKRLGINTKKYGSFHAELIKDKTLIRTLLLFSASGKQICPSLSPIKISTFNRKYSKYKVLA